MNSMRGVVLELVEPALVRNLSETGGPGKLRSYWKETIYIVKERIADGPVHKVIRVTVGKRVRTLHRNLFHLVNVLPDCPTQQSQGPPTEKK